MGNNYCVYKHTAPSGKVYIGITCKKPEVRWANGKGYWYNKHFSRAIEKYGWGNISHEVIAEGLTAEQASSREQTLISLYQADDARYGYNKTSGGEIGFKFRGENKRNFDRIMRDPARRDKVSQGLKKHYEDPKARQKLSEAQKRKWENAEYRKRFLDSLKARNANSEYRAKLSRIWTEKRSNPDYRQSMTGAKNPNAHSVLQYSLTGELIKRYGSIAEAAREVNGNHANICACINGRIKSSYGYVWVYEGNEHEVCAKVKRIQSYINQKSRAVLQIDLEGNIVQKYNSITEACATIGASAGTLRMALRGKRKTAYKSIWKYASEEVSDGLN